MAMTADVAPLRRRRPQRPTTARDRRRSAPISSCRDMHAYYGESYIVQGVSFEIAEREVLALLGRNGAGKTSTLRTIARAPSPELKQGEIWLQGQAAAPDAKLSRRHGPASCWCRRTAASSRA